MTDADVSAATEQREKEGCGDGESEEVNRDHINHSMTLGYMHGS